MLYAIAFLAGIVAGLRTMTAPAAVSWAARLGGLHLDGTILAFLGAKWTPWIFTILALGEYVTDQLPTTPSRLVPLQLAGRMASGALCGAALAIGSGNWIIGLIAGVAGALVGTYGGAAARARLAAAFGRDPPAGLSEDAIAVVLAVLIVLGTR